MVCCVVMEVALLVMDYVVQIHGGYGYTVEYVVEGLYCDVWVVVFVESIVECDWDCIVVRIIVY